MKGVLLGRVPQQYDGSVFFQSFSDGRWPLDNHALVVATVVATSESPHPRSHSARREALAPGSWSAQGLCLAVWTRFISPLSYTRPSQRSAQGWSALDCDHMICFGRGKGGTQRSTKCPHTSPRSSLFSVAKYGAPSARDDRRLLEAEEEEDDDDAAEEEKRTSTVAADAEEELLRKPPLGGLRRLDRCRVLRLAEEKELSMIPGMMRECVMSLM